MEEFGQRDDHFEEDGEIISHETIFRSIDEGTAFRIMQDNKPVGGVVIRTEYDLLAFSEDFPEGAPVKKTSNEKKTDTADAGEDTDDTDSENSEKPEDTVKTENGGSNTIILVAGAALLIGGGTVLLLQDIQRR